MKVLYFDCSSGISGNMAMGALLELTGDADYLLAELEKLHVDGYHMEITKKVKNGITGTHVNVIVDGEDEYGHVHHLEAHRDGEGQEKPHESRQDDHDHGFAHADHHEYDYEHHGTHHDHDDHQEHMHDHDERHERCYDHEHDDDGHTHAHDDHDEQYEHHHDHGHVQDGHDEHHEHHHDHAHHHPHRNLRDVNEIIERSTLDESTKDLAKRIFLRVAKAESKVHNRPLEEVHFHEVGAIDSIVDIVGCAILINRIKPERIFSGVLNEGHGFIECAHGIMGVPVPATSEIFAEGNVRFRQIDIDTELVTPTGAAIIAELAESFGTMPEMTVEKIGWGAGTKELKIPNVLKVIMGNAEEIKSLNRGSSESEREVLKPGIHEMAEKIVVMETNIDDCNAEILGYTMEKLFESGARDVFFTPVYMKKNRPAYRLTVACMPQDIEKLQKIIFCETTTIGIRYRYEERCVLDRELVEIETKYGSVKAKKVRGAGGEWFYPEYESLRRIAQERQIPLKELYGSFRIDN